MLVKEGPKVTMPEQKQVCHETKEVFINIRYEDQGIQIRKGLPGSLKEGLLKLLKESVDVFVREAVEMTGIRRQLVEHKLNDKLGNKPI